MKRPLTDQACSSARVTHAHPVGMDGAAVQALAVAQAVKLDPHEEFSQEAFIHKEPGFQTNFRGTL